MRVGVGREQSADWLSVCAGRRAWESGMCGAAAGCAGVGCAERNVRNFSEILIENKPSWLRKLFRKTDREANEKRSYAKFGSRRCTGDRSTCMYVVPRYEMSRLDRRLELSCAFAGRSRALPTVAVLLLASEGKSKSRAAARARPFHDLASDHRRRRCRGCRRAPWQ